MKVLRLKLNQIPDKKLANDLTVLKHWRLSIADHKNIFALGQTDIEAMQNLKSRLIRLNWPKTMLVIEN